MHKAQARETTSGDQPMRAISPLARAFFAIAMVAFGIQHFIYGKFVTRIAQEPPA